MLSDTHGPLTHSSQAQVDALGFDVLFLSDLLHFDTSHDVLALSIASLLTRNAEARVCASIQNVTTAVLEFGIPNRMCWDIP